MRRGLLEWSPDEVPAETLKKRLLAVQAMMKEQGLDALLLYTDQTRPAAVSRLVQFIPYWNRCVLVVRTDGPPVLCAGLSNRVAGWIKEASAVTEVVCSPRLAQSVGDLVGEGDAIGVVELSLFPRDIAEGVAEPSQFRDVTQAFEAALATAPGPSEILAQRAQDVGRAGLDAAEQAFETSRGNAVIAEAERAARRAGAEEVLISVAPDASRNPRLRRVEGKIEFGERAFFRLSVAYKGSWLRLGRTLISDADSNARNAREQLGTVPLSSGVDAARQVAEAANGTLVDWRLEGPLGGLPLADLGGLDHERLPPELLSLTVRLNLPDGPWFGAVASTKTN